jgi:superfamily II DNA helicase RecQ
VTTGFEDAALAVLRRALGDSAQFRDGQLEAIEALVEQRRRLLVVQRTGWGKSAVYFVATRLLRDRGAGTTISDWGHDFRPDYRRLVRVLDFMPPGLPVLCTTATLSVTN